EKTGRAIWYPRGVSMWLVFRLSMIIGILLAGGGRLFPRGIIVVRVQRRKALNGRWYSYPVCRLKAGLSRGSGGGKNKKNNGGCNEIF
ncbi:MAG: hypothetical protein J5969_07060, partial [Lachnospiraceae bacterium]|nr:hypothetical protein [Lachnospiraceae bacterium]